MNRRMIAYVVALVALVVSGTVFAAEKANIDGRGRLPRATPESQGVSSVELVKVIDGLDQKIKTMNSIIVVLHGKVIAEAYWAPFNPKTRHALYSLSKSFTSTAIGMAVAEGRLTLDDPVVKFFPDDLPPVVSDNLKEMKVRHLLSMSCGHEHEPKIDNLMMGPYRQTWNTTDDTWTTRFLKQPVPFEPGTHFRYNSVGTFMLSAIIKKTTGSDLFDYIKPRLFDPLEFDNPTWEKNPEGISKGGTGLRLTTEDIAKFGQLYLQKGMWNGKRILSEEWVKTATSKHVSNGTAPDSDWAQGYGFQFWRCRHNTYRGDGAYSQFCVVTPDKDLVVAITSDTNQYQDELNVLWDILLPALGDKPLPENARGNAELAKRVKELKAKEGASGPCAMDDLVFSSALLNRDVNYSVYLPNGYRTDDFNYPILYLLHGASGSHRTWLSKDKGNLEKIAGDWFAEHPDRKTIIVMPDAVNSWYVNDVKSGILYEDFFFKEFIPYIEKTFRCKPGKENRAIAGLSMGGFGSILYALHHPDMFRSCYAMSAAVRTDDEIRDMGIDDAKRRLLRLIDSVEPGHERITPSYLKNSPHYLVMHMPDEQKKAVRFFLDCGDDDYLIEGNCKLHLEMTKAGITHEFRVRDGAHHWDYWRSALPMALDFISDGTR